MKAPVTLRAATPDDLPLIVDSWLNSYRRAAAVREVDGRLYFSDVGHRGLILRLLNQSGVAVACDKEDPSSIFGWACYGGEGVHYAYVKQPYRRMGICRALLGSDHRIVVTHTTPALYAYARATGQEVVYNPYLLLGGP